MTVIQFTLMKYSSLFLLLVCCLIANVRVVSAQNKVHSKTLKPERENTATLALDNILANSATLNKMSHRVVKKDSLFGMPVFDPSDRINAKMMYMRPPAGYYYSMPNALPDKISSAGKKDK